MSLAALPTFLIVPPVNLLLPCFAATLLPRRWARLGRVLLAAGLGALLLLSLPIVSRSLIVSLERGLSLRPPADDPPSAIVILSGDTAGMGDTLEVGALTLERERAGAALARSTKLPILVTGGRLPDDSGNLGSVTLGGLMALSLDRDFGVPVRWVEAEAQDTAENARFSAAMLREHGIHSIYLVTHAWHMKRALQAFAGTGISVTPSPVRMDASPRLRFVQFVPRAGAWLESYYALHEWIGWTVAALRASKEGLEARDGAAERPAL
jgi:uncharacterized SAM-binding protein YcdF (DUF218 family)